MSQIAVNRNEIEILENLAWGSMTQSVVHHPSIREGDIICLVSGESAQRIVHGRLQLPEIVHGKWGGISV